MVELSTCLVCGKGNLCQLRHATFAGRWDEAVPYFLTCRRSSRHGRIVRCADCGFVATSPQFTPTEYTRIYERVPRATSPAATRAHAIRYRDLRGRLCRYVSAGPFLDLGCGDGGFLREMHGFEGIGFEIASGPLHRDGAVYRGPFPAFCDAVLAAAPGRLAFVTAWDVIEHLPEPDTYAAQLSAALADGGYLFCSLPNVSSLAARLWGAKWNCLLLEHLWYFNPATLRDYFARFGLRLVACSAFAFPAVASVFLDRLSQTFGVRLPRPPEWSDKWVFRIPAGMMFAVLRKRGTPPDAAVVAGSRNRGDGTASDRVRIGVQPRQVLRPGLDATIFPAGAQALE
jgi:SAM-dependent methyltransferase